MINLDDLSTQTGVRFPHLVKALKEYDHKEMVHFNYAEFDIKLVGLSPREDKYTLHELLKSIQIIYQNKEEKINAMIDFVLNQKQCRQQQLLAYFGESKASNCANCNANSCKKTTPIQETAQLAEEIIHLLHPKPMTVHQLALSLPQFSKEEIGFALEWLEINKKIEKNNRQQIVLL